ncbi:MAG: ABC transporter permease [Phycisphaerales bacterium]|nr:MAG: ABC transporter permease [Phycisphaerales bacterium]
MAASPAQSRPPFTSGQVALPPRRWRVNVGVCGVVVLVIMSLLCFGSLPWTLGTVPAAAAETDAATPTGMQPRRYAATHLEGALLPPVWAAHTEDERARRNEAVAAGTPLPRYLLGSDQLGRDLLARLLLGGAISLSIGILAAFIAVIIGTLYGSLAGACGGRIDAVMMRLVDIFFGLPTILLVVLFAVAVDGVFERMDAAGREGMLAGLGEHRGLINLLTLFIAIGGVSWLTMARVIRGQVLSLKARPFMEACRALGIPPHRQFFRHLLPNLLGPIIVYATLAVPAAILTESFLSFLGIGVREPLPSWGNLAAAGLNELNLVRSRWWMLLWPCLMIALTLLALNFAGEALRDRYDLRRVERANRT